MDDTLSPVAQLPPAKKANIETDWRKCVICQIKESKNDNLGMGTTDGLKRLQEAAIIRNDIVVIGRLALDHDTLLEHGAKWHKGCYSTFTSSMLLARITSKRLKDSSSADVQTSTTFSGSLQLTRSQENDPKWEHCLICGKGGRDLCQIRTFQASDRLRLAATERKDDVVLLRIGNYDLIAVEGKYHRSCYQTFTSPDRKQRRIQKGIQYDPP